LPTEKSINYVTPIFRKQESKKINAMKKLITGSVAALVTLTAFLMVTFASCSKDEEDQGANTFTITLYNPYSYAVYVQSNAFANTNHCNVVNYKSGEYDCILRAGETKTYTGQVEEDYGYVAIFFADVADEDNQDKQGIFDFDARGGQDYCGELINMDDLSPQNQPEVFLRSGGNCYFGNNNGGGGNGTGGGGNGTGGGGSGNNTGSVTFWCNSNDDVFGYVQFNNRLREQFLYYFANSVPDCFEKGTISYTATAGDYQYELFWMDANHNVIERQKGYVTVTAKGCSKVLVKKK